MKCIYGCQRVVRNESGKLAHAHPVLIVEGDSVDSGKIVDVQGPAEILTDRENQPPEVRRCKDHCHSIWIQTVSPVSTDGAVVPLRTPETKRIYVCTTVAKAEPGTYQQGAIIFDSAEGQRTARHLKLLGPSRIIFDEHNPIIGYCPCKQSHPHRMWIETDGEIELVA